MATLAPLFTQQDLIDRVSLPVLIRLTDDDKSGAVDVNVVAAIIRDASSVIWSFLPPDYTLPTSGIVPDYLKKLAVDIGQGQLYNRFPQTNLASEGTQLLGRAMTELERFSGGITNVPEVAEASPPAFVFSDSRRASLTR